MLCAVHATADSDCNIRRPASEDDLKNGKAALLIKNLSSACANKSPTEFFAQQTSRVRLILSKETSTEQMKYLNLLCGQLARAFKNPEALSYSLEQGRARKCGQPISELWANGQNGEPILRMTVAVENDRLRLDEL
jgi:hypothetical protein